MTWKVNMEAKKPLPVNRKRLEGRVAGRTQGRELFSLLSDGDSKDKPFMEALVEEFQLRGGLLNPPEPEPPAEPIARLGSTPIPFGQYKGQDFDSVPIDYLDWLCREHEAFYKTLRAYLKHPELESRRGGLRT